MCGISGLVDPAGGAVDRDVLAKMTRSLAPRGPDGEGLWFGPGVGLGHRRLAVIDLSSAAEQPMGNEDGSVQVVFNGEIYNFAELRAELLARGHTFRSRSDTEVLVHGYEEWGDDMVARLDGMFAFALWDLRRKRLLAARDRMGKKPFYWAQLSRPGSAPLLAFGSELKSILALPGLSREIDQAALVRYLTYEYVPPPYTIFSAVRKLDSGQRLVLEAGSDPLAPPRIDRYWDLPFPGRHVRVDEEEAAEELRRLLRRAVEKRLISDVPLGVFLSGGIDSSTVAALMVELCGAQRVQTFSMGFWDPTFDESSHAETVARHLGTEHRAEKLEPSRLLAALPEVVRFMDEPLADASILPTYLLASFTRQHVTVALGGDGGDELFAGYPTFKADLASRLYDRVPAALRRMVRNAAELLPAKTGYFSLDFKVHQFLRGGDQDGPRRHQRWLASVLPEELPALLSPDLRQAAAADPLADVDARASSSSARHRADRLMDFYARFYLPGDVNVKVDRASSAVGLEVRAPFLDTDVVRFACQLSPGLRLRRLTSKYLLKRAMRAHLPEEIVGRRKQGFGVPVARWMKEELAGELRDELAPDRLRRDGLFDPAFVEGLVQDHLGGRRDRRKVLWTLFVFQRWMSTWARAA